MLIREELERWEEQRLAPYAMRSSQSRGRHYPEPEHAYRTAFQRDRDKVIHTPSFRRLEYKTQVFVNFEGDHYRTRLTHSLEATQIARTIARALAANEDLTEAISLAHDLGHPPFGHAGEEVLNRAMLQHGEPQGFEHNRHCLRIVDELEGKHPHHPGLNLTWEVREGIAKHPFAGNDPALEDFQATPNPTLEAQIADIADEIAYNCHDLDDGIRAGLVEWEVLETNALWQEALKEVAQHYGSLERETRRYRAVKHLIDRLVTDAITATLANLRQQSISSPQNVRNATTRIAAFSPETLPLAQGLQDFLHQHVYNHYQVVRMQQKAKRLLTDLFQAYMEQPKQLPQRAQKNAEVESLPRAVCYYIAGMTDRYALEEHQRLFEMDTRLLP